MYKINPVVETIKTNKKISEPIKYPVKVYCIVDDLSEASRNTLLRDIKSHAINSGAIFTTREYDSSKFSNDRDVIQRLPAFHIHINKVYNRTFYPNTRPLDHINECIKIHLTQEENKEIRKERWRKWYDSLRKWISKFKFRETAMEKYEREQNDVTEKSRFKNIKQNTVSISNWN